MKRLMARLCLYACIVTGVLTYAAYAQDCSDLYNPNQLLTLDITMDPADWESLLVSCPGGVCELPHTYWEAYLSCGGSAPILIGIRRKNDLAEPSEEDPQKVSLKLDINEFVSGQRFAGKKKLSTQFHKYDDVFDCPLGGSRLAFSLAEGGCYAANQPIYDLVDRRGEGDPPGNGAKIYVIVY